MIETLTVRQRFDGKAWPGRLPEDTWRTQNTGTPFEGAFLKKGSIDGLHVQLKRQGTDALLIGQITLPTLAYKNPSAKVGTLEKSRVLEGLTNGLTIMKSMFPDIVRSVDHWDVRRMDTSVTLKPQGKADEHVERVIIERAHNLAMQTSSRKQDAIMFCSNGWTAARGKRGSTATPYDRIYQKSVEARNFGFEDVPDGLLRAERERIMNEPVTKWMDNQEQIMDSDLDALAAWFNQAQAGYHLALAQTLLEAQKIKGEKPNPSEAAMLAGLIPILSMSGPKGLMDGLEMNRRTAYRRAGRVRDLLEAITPEEVDKRLYVFWEAESYFWSKEASETVKKAAHEMAEEMQANKRSA